MFLGVVVEPLGEKTQLEYLDIRILTPFLLPAACKPRAEPLALPQGPHHDGLHNQPQAPSNRRRKLFQLLCAINVRSTITWGVGPLECRCGNSLIRVTEVERPPLCGSTGWDMSWDPGLDKREKVS